MPDAADLATRLYLIAPEQVGTPEGAARLDAALAGGDVAAVLFRVAAEPHRGLADAVAIAQNRSVAALIDAGSAEACLTTAQAVGADGVHCSAEFEDVLALLKRRPKALMVGTGSFRSRHESMVAAEAGADYVMFGRLDGPSLAEPHPQAVEEAAWWAETFEVPAVLLGGSDLESVPLARASGAEFIALREAVWDHPEGPAAAVGRALVLLQSMESA